VQAAVETRLIEERAD